MNFVAIDFETANAKRFSPCSIGIVVANHEGIVDEYYSLINPLMEFHSYNTYIHGITEKDVLNAPTFVALWPKISHFFSESIVIAHNASFDMSVLRHTFDYFDIEYPTFDYLCSVMLSKQVWPGLSNYKLNTLANFNNILFNHHNALEDARVAAEIMIRAMKEKDVTSLVELIDQYQISKGRIHHKGYVSPKLRNKKTKV